MIKASTLDIAKQTRIQFLLFVPKLNLVKTQYQRNPSTDLDNYPNFGYIHKEVKAAVMKKKERN